MKYDPYCTHPLSGPARLGEKVTWSPSCFVRSQESCYLLVDQVVHGSVIYVNDAHRYYTVEGSCNGHTIRESFKF